MQAITSAMTVYWLDRKHYYYTAFSFSYSVMSFTLLFPLTPDSVCTVWSISVTPFPLMEIKDNPVTLADVLNLETVPCNTSEKFIRNSLALAACRDNTGREIRRREDSLSEHYRSTELVQNNTTLRDEPQGCMMNHSVIIKM